MISIKRAPLIPMPTWVCLSFCGPPPPKKKMGKTIWWFSLWLPSTKPRKRSTLKKKQTHAAPDARPFYEIAIGSEVGTQYSLPEPRCSSCWFSGNGKRGFGNEPRYLKGKPQGALRSLSTSFGRALAGLFPLGRRYCGRQAPSFLEDSGERNFFWALFSQSASHLGHPSRERSPGAPIHYGHPDEAAASRRSELWILRKRAHFDSSIPSTEEPLVLAIEEPEASASQDRIDSQSCRATLRERSERTSTSQRDLAAVHWQRLEPRCAPTSDPRARQRLPKLGFPDTSEMGAPDLGVKHSV